MPPLPTVRYVHYYRMPGVPPEEYEDWMNIAESDAELAALDIKAGNVPPGVILSWCGALWSVWSDRMIRRYA